MNSSQSKLSQKEIIETLEGIRDEICNLADLEQNTKKKLGLTLAANHIDDAIRELDHNSKRWWQFWKKRSPRKIKKALLRLIDYLHDADVVKELIDKSISDLVILI